jgi:hypothetical protein
MTSKVMTSEEAAGGPKNLKKIFCLLLHENEPIYALFPFKFQNQLVLLHNVQ